MCFYFFTKFNISYYPCVHNNIIPPSPCMIAAFVSTSLPLMTGKVINYPCKDLPLMTYWSIYIICNLFLATETI